MNAIEVAKASLSEFGLPHIADLIEESHTNEGMPSISSLYMFTENHDAIVKSLTMGHISVGHEAKTYRYDDRLWIRCIDCNLGRDRD